MRKFLRHLLMLHPGYRKSHFVELEVQALRRELVGLFEGNEARVKEAIAAARPADRTDELKEAIAAARPADRTDELKEAIAAAHGELAKQIETVTECERKVIRDSCEILFRNDIRCRWQVVDALDPLLFPRTTEVKCMICGHTAQRDAYETKVTECIFGGGRLERYVCPACGAIFGPLKMMALDQGQMAEEYRQNYSVYSESDCTLLEKIAFEALKPRKDGVYLNFGAGAWNKTTGELREAGFQVYDFEPYAPAAASEWVLRTREELTKRKFDGIFSNDLIEHLQDPVEDLKFMTGLLKPDGRMSHASGCYEYAFEYTRFHLFFLTGQSLDRLASSAGLSYELGERLFSYSPARVCLFSRNKDKRR